MHIQHSLTSVAMLGQSSVMLDYTATHLASIYHTLVWLHASKHVCGLVETHYQNENGLRSLRSDICNKTLPPNKREVRSDFILQVFSRRFNLKQLTNEK